MKKANVVAFTIAAGSITALWLFVHKLHKMQLNLEAIPKAKLHKVDLNGITIRLDVVLKNPTKGSLSIKFPFVKLSYKGATIGSSEVINKDIEIPAYGQAVIEKIMIDIPLLNAFSVVSEIIKAIQNKETVKIKAKVVTTVFAGMSNMPINMPFDKSYDLTVKS